MSAAPVWQVFLVGLATDLTTGLGAWVKIDLASVVWLSDQSWGLWPDRSKFRQSGWWQKTDCSYFIA